MNEFFTRKTTEVEIAIGTEKKKINLRKVTPGLLLKLKSFGGPVSKVLTVWQLGRSNDVGTCQTEKDGAKVTEMEAISPEMATLRSDQLEAAIQSCFDTLFSEGSMEILDEILRTCVEDFGDETPGTLCESLSIEAVVAILKAIFLDNVGVIGFLGKSSLQETLIKVANQIPTQ